MRVFPSLLLCCGLFLLAVGHTFAAEGTEADEYTLQAAGLRTSGPALLGFLRLRSQTSADDMRLQVLARHLADPSAVVREQAAAELLAHGQVALPVLRR